MIFLLPPFRRHQGARPLPRPNPMMVDPYDKNLYNGTTVGGKEYASTVGLRNNISKHRSFSGEYASIWESQYPMTLHHHQTLHEDTFATPMSGIPDSNHFSTHTGLPPQLPPRVEHIYESPKFDRCESSSRSVSDLPLYFELDPDDSDKNQNHSSTMPRTAAGDFFLSSRDRHHRPGHRES